VAECQCDNGPVVIGIGNLLRRDDAIGLATIGLMRARLPPGVRLVECDGEARSLLAEVQSAHRVWLIDAARSGAPPGTIHRIDCAASDAIVPRGDVSSHGFGVAEAIALARALGTLPPHCVVYAIEAADFTYGATPSPAVTKAAREVAERILAELATPPPP
jgi:hydrogenase maturation protease